MWTVLGALLVLAVPQSAAQEAPPPLVWESLTPTPPITGIEDLSDIRGLTFIGDTLTALSGSSGGEIFHWHAADREWEPVYTSFLPLRTAQLASFEVPPGADGFPAGGGRVLFTYAGRRLERWTDGGRAMPDTVRTALGFPFRTATGRLGRAFDGVTTQANFVAYSSDHGASWTEHTYGQLDWLDYPVDAVAYAPGPYPDGSGGQPEGPYEERVVAAGYTGLMVSTDDGETWTESPVYGPYRCKSIAKVAAGPRDGGYPGRAVAWCIDYEADHGYLWSSDDRGETWTQRFENPTVGPSTGYVTAGPDGSLFAHSVSGEDRGSGRIWPIYSSSDGGQTWHERGEVWTEWPFRLEQLAVGPDGHLYAGGSPDGATSGEVAGGVFRTVEPVVVAAEPSVPTEQPGFGVRAFPNPSSGAVTVALTGAASGESVRVALYDSLGREVAVLHDGPLSVRERLAVEPGALAPGRYVARAEARGAVATASFTVAQ
jgi:hypothetical protein